MKVIYNYAAGPEFADSLAALSATQLDVAVCPESDDARFFELLRDAEVLWHCLRPVDARVIDAAPRLQARAEDRRGREHDRSRARPRAQHRGVQHAGHQQSRRGGTHAWLDARGVAADPALRRRYAARRRLVVGRRSVRTDSARLPVARSASSAWAAFRRLLAPTLDRNGRDRDLHGARCKARSCRTTFVALDDTARTRRHRQPARAVVRRDTPSAECAALRANAPRQRADQHRARRAGRRSGADRRARCGNVSPRRVSTCSIPSPLHRDNPLLQRDDVVVTPHIAWLTRETLQRSLDVAVANCHRLANAQPLLHRVV